MCVNHRVLGFWRKQIVQRIIDRFICVRPSSRLLAIYMITTICERTGTDIVIVIESEFKLSTLRQSICVPLKRCVCVCVEVHIYVIEVIVYSM